MRSKFRRPILTLAFVFTGPAMAHGPVAEQAAKAVGKATELYLKNEKPGDFQSVSAELTGDEEFSVKITNKTGQAVAYRCGLDTQAKPVKWGCKRSDSK